MRVKSNPDLERLRLGEQGPYDIDDYMQLPEEGPRFQLMRGWLVREPSPTEKHQTVVGNLYLVLRRWIDGRHLGRVYLAPFDTVLSRHDVVQPDLLFVSRARLGSITPQSVQGAPDLVVEVLSLSTRRRDTKVKVQLYQEAGVREIWLVDPEAEQLEVVDVSSSDAVKGHFAGNQHVVSGVFGPMDFAVAELFQTVV